MRSEISEERLLAQLKRFNSIKFVSTSKRASERANERTKGSQRAPLWGQLAEPAADRAARSRIERQKVIARRCCGSACVQIITIYDLPAIVLAARRPNSSSSSRELVRAASACNLSPAQANSCAGSPATVCSTDPMRADSSQSYLHQQQIPMTDPTARRENKTKQNKPKLS